MPRSQPLRLSAAEGVQPAQTGMPADDQPHGQSRTDSGAAATFIHIHGDGASEVVTVDASTLAILLHDGVMVPLDWVDARPSKRRA
jgi:hypothetical protein